jgi:hypothetical protein
MEERLKFIDLQLKYVGFIQKAHLMEQFGISESTANKTFGTYKKKTGIKFNRKLKAYVKA